MDPLDRNDGAGMTRRNWLLGASAVAAAALAGLRAGDATARSTNDAPAADLTPEQALARLMEGNRRFAAGHAKAPHRTLARLRETAPAQAPFAAVLGCADSRVPVEIVFDQGFGDVFVARVAGNVATPEQIASLEFGTLVLGAKALLVLGHSSCGAVKAAIAGQEVPGQISALFQHIRPAVGGAAGTDLGKVTEQNVRLQANLLAGASPVLAKLVAERRLVIAGGVYDLATGVVSPVALA